MCFLPCGEVAIFGQFSKDPSIPATKISIERFTEMPADKPVQALTMLLVTSVVRGKETGMSIVILEINTVNLHMLRCYSNICIEMSRKSTGPFGLLFISHCTVGDQ